MMTNLREEKPEMRKRTEDHPHRRSKHVPSKLSNGHRSTSPHEKSCAKHYPFSQKDKFRNQRVLMQRNETHTTTTPTPSPKHSAKSDESSESNVSSTTHEVLLRERKGGDDVAREDGSQARKSG